MSSNWVKVLLSLEFRFYLKIPESSFLYSVVPGFFFKCTINSSSLVQWIVICSEEFSGKKKKKIKKRKKKFVKVEAICRQAISCQSDFRKLFRSLFFNSFLGEIRERRRSIESAN